MSFKNWVKFVLLGLIWGTNFLWIKIGLRGIGPVTMVAIRCFFATSALFAYNMIVRSKFPPVKHWGYLIIMGIFNLAIPFLVISWGQQFITSGLASILNSTVPLITILIAHFTLVNDRINIQKLLGLLIGFGGVIVLVSDVPRHGSNHYLVGELGMLLAGFSIAATLVLAQKNSLLVSPEIVSGGQVFTAFLFSSVLIPILEAPVNLPTQPLTWVALLWLGFINSTIGPLLYFSLIRDIGATRTSLLNYIFPLVGVIAGVIFLEERPSWFVFLGGILIIIGIAVVNSQTDTLSRWMNKITKIRKETLP